MLMVLVVHQKTKHAQQQKKKRAQNVISRDKKCWNVSSLFSFFILSQKICFVHSVHAVQHFNSVPSALLAKYYFNLAKYFSHSFSRGSLKNSFSLSLSKLFSRAAPPCAPLSLNPNLIVVVPVNYSHSARILPYIDGISVELSNDKTRSNIISLLYCTPAVTVTVTVTKTKTKTKNRNHDQNVNDGVTPTEAGVVAS